MKVESQVGFVDHERQIPFADISELPLQVHRIHKPSSYVELKDKSAEPIIENIDVSEGFHPFGPPPIYTGEGGPFYTENNLQKAVDFITRRHQLKEGSEVVLGSQGSNEIIERIMMSLEDDTTVMGIGPHFIGVTKAVEVTRHAKYISFPTDLTKDGQEILQQVLDDIPSDDDLIKEFEEKGNLHAYLPSVLYVSNPDSRGCFTSKEFMSKFVKRLTSLGTMVIVDEALADYFPDEESVADLTSDNSHLIVLRSYSKGLGIPGEGLAYMIAHKTYADEYNAQRRDLHVRGDNINLFNDIVDEEFYKHMAMVRNHTQIYKQILLQLLDEHNIPYLPTSVQTPIVFIDGGQEGFADLLEIKAASGAGFVSTHRNYFGEQISSRYARISLPVIDYDDPDTDVAGEYLKLIKALSGAINKAAALRDPKQQRVTKL